MLVRLTVLKISKEQYHFIYKFLFITFNLIYKDYTITILSIHISVLALAINSYMLLGSRYQNGVSNHSNDPSFLSIHCQGKM